MEAKNSATSPKGLIGYIINFFTARGIEKELSKQYDNFIQAVTTSIEENNADPNSYHLPEKVEFNFKGCLVTIISCDPDKVTIKVEGKKGKSFTSEISEKEFKNVATLLLLQKRLNLSINMKEGKIDLSNINLSGKNLSGIYLEGANLSFADLSEADLSGANLENANMMSSIFNKAKLIQTNLNGANLENAQLKNANLNSALLNKVRMFNTNLIESTLINADLSEANITISIFGWADLQDAKLNNAIIYASSLTLAEMSGVDLTGSDLFTRK
ncbi:MAG: pentapeptide repeat-containing protein [Arsenophonus endosymbiont of Dermacentor nuttalli]